MLEVRGLSFGYAGEARGESLHGVSFTIGPGEVVGELGLLLRRDHAATVTATTPIEIIGLPQAALREAIEDVPGLAWNLLQTVADRLSDGDVVSG